MDSRVRRELRAEGVLEVISACGSLLRWTRSSGGKILSLGNPGQKSRELEPNAEKELTRESEKKGQKGGRKVGALGP